MKTLYVWGILYQLCRVPHQIVAGNQSILHCVETSHDAVMVSALAVGVDDLLRAVFFRHVREAAATFQDCWWDPDYLIQTAWPVLSGLRRNLRML